MNSRLLKVGESVTIRIADLARDLEHHGEKVVKLQTGDPDFATPEIVITAAHKAMKDGFTHYTGSRGLLELRQALANKFLVENGIIYDPGSEILVTHGAAHAIFITMQTLLEPGDEVIIIEPFYMSFASSVTIAGGVPVPVGTDPGQEFALDFDRVRAAISSRTKMIIVNSPCNPSGIVLTREETMALAQIAAEHNLFIICDDVYEKILYDGAKHSSIASLPDMRERTITINSLSKTYAMTGWRLGYIGAPAKIVQEMLKVLQYSATSIAPFSQKAAIVALTTPELADYIEKMRQTYDQRRLAGLAAVAEFEGLRALRPKGAFYLMLDISQFSRDSVGFTFRLLEKARVAVVPGVAFGKSAEGWVRLTYAVEEETFVEGIRRLGQFAHSEYKGVKRGD